MQNLSCRSHQWSGSSSHTWGQSQDIFDGPNGPENQNSIQIQGTKDRAWRKGVFLLTGLPGPPSGAGPDRELRGFGASRVQKARWGRTYGICGVWKAPRIIWCQQSYFGRFQVEQ